jgi:hypothetical protein
MPLRGYLLSVLIYLISCKNPDNDIFTSAVSTLKESLNSTQRDNACCNRVGAVNALHLIRKGWDEERICSIGSLFTTRRKQCAVFLFSVNMYLVASRTWYKRPEDFLGGGTSPWTPGPVEVILGTDLKHIDVLCFSKNQPKCPKERPRPFIRLFNHRRGINFGESWTY